MSGLMDRLLETAGKGCMGWGGFLVDEEGRLIEEYGEGEDWPEGTERGTESKDGKETGGTDCVRRAAERGGA